MRLTQIKLAGFKSFVDPTVIATPGQLVGIVGPNGCGKSNVIDAVRWVLGESKASALRGESMQDVIFNGAGDRKPVGRASVELFFDNSQGRIGGQWGQYTELSIKRVLTREGDSTYYINNIPVRRRDIHDLFLGTGLGPRAYAIIEQGMISRVIEAKPEELRIFLEEAAGVSKYKERRKETEGRLADTRENLSRVEDIRGELGAQIARLDAQAEGRDRIPRARNEAQAIQHMLWFAKQQDAARLRERHSTEIANLTAGFEALQADLRAAENRLETLRAEHFKAGDALHERQGAFYAANAEVTRLEQQLEFARESEGRLSQQVAQITEQIAAFTAQLGAIASDAEARRARGRSGTGAARGRRRRGTRRHVRRCRRSRPRSPRRRARWPRSSSRRPRSSSRSSWPRRGARVPRSFWARSHSGASDSMPRTRELAAPVNDQIALVTDQLEQESADLAGREESLAALNAVVQALQEAHRAAGDEWQATSSGLAEREARAQALEALQAKIGSGKDALRGCTRMGSSMPAGCGSRSISSPAGRTRSRACCASDSMRSSCRRWTPPPDGLRGDVALPGRIAAYAPGGARHGGNEQSDALLGKVKGPAPASTALLGDWLAGMRCRNDLAAALRDRGSLSVGEAFVTPAGHVVTAQAVGFFAPDSELHGVLARQRELAELDHAIRAARAATAAAASAREAAENELKARQQEYHGESMALSSQQRRCHDLELELLQLKQVAEASERRRAQIAEELAALAVEERTEHDAMAAIDAEVAAQRTRLGAQTVERERARHARNEAEVTLARGRERSRAAERAAQEAGFAERSCRERIAELARRREAIAAQVAQQEALLAQLATERQQIDWTPVEQSLQAQLVTRGGTEQALAAARDRLEAIAAELRAADELRLAADQKLEPARSRIEEVRLKEQAAELSERNTPSNSPRRMPSSRSCRSGSRPGAAPARCRPRSSA